MEPEDVDRLIAKWDDRLLTPLVVSFRDGKFNVVDGQHRIAAMRKMADGGNVTVPCLIYTGLSYEQEAELYFNLLIYRYYHEVSLYNGDGFAHNTAP